MTSSIKPKEHNISPSEEDRDTAISSMHKILAIEWTWDYEDMLEDRQTHRPTQAETNRHVHHITLRRIIRCIMFTVSVPVNAIN